MSGSYIRFSNPVSFAFFSYWFYWLLYDGEFVISIPLLLGSIGMVISLFSIYFSSDRILQTESLAISGIIASAATFFLWTLAFGRNPYIRELPTVFLLCLSTVFGIRGFRSEDEFSSAVSLIICEIALGITLGWWGGRAFEGKSRTILVIVLLLAVFSRVVLARIARGFGECLIGVKERWAFFLFSLAIGLIASKYDIESRAPWSQAVYDLHLGSQKLLPVLVSWLISASIVLAYISISTNNLPVRNESNGGLE